MSEGREIRCFDYVNHRYEQVRDALKKDALGVFRAATKSAASRVRSVASELRVDVGGVSVEADILIEIAKIDEQTDAMSGPVTRLDFEWRAAKLPGLFPLMKAELSIYPLTATETNWTFWAITSLPWEGWARP